MLMAAHLKRPAPTAPPKRSEPGSAKETDPRKPLPLHAGARLTARVALAMALVAAALWTAADFLPALAWAAILAIAVWPLYMRGLSAPTSRRRSRRSCSPHWSA